MELCIEESKSSGCCCKKTVFFGEIIQVWNNLVSRRARLLLYSTNDTLVLLSEHQWQHKSIISSPEPDQKGLKLKIKNAFILLLKFLKGLKSHYINNLFSSSSSKSKGKPSKIPINLPETYRIFWVLSWIEVGLLRFKNQISLVTFYIASVWDKSLEWKRQKHTLTHKYTGHSSSFTILS